MLQPAHIGPTRPTAYNAIQSAVRPVSVCGEFPAVGAMGNTDATGEMLGQALEIVVVAAERDRPAMWMSLFRMSDRPIVAGVSRS